MFIFFTLSHSLITILIDHRLLTSLTQFARFMGFELFDRQPPFIRIRITDLVSGESKIEQYEQLALLDFTSKRKR